jgi:UTP--glucose-1-phosphate uridylyltransferase
MIKGVVEKPRMDQAPSTSAISMRYILQPEIFDILSYQPPGSGGEIQLTDALSMLQREQAFWAYRFEGQTFDCRDKLKFLKANVALALDHKDLGQDFRQSLYQLLQIESDSDVTQVSASGGFR